MRIAHLINDLDYGGAEKIVASLAACQCRQGDSIHLVCLRDLGAQPVDLTGLVNAGVQLVTLGKPEGIHVGTLRKLAALLRSQRIDVVHTHNHLVHHYGAAAGRMAGTPAIVTTLHGSASLRSSAAWSKAVFRASCAVSHRVVSVCAQVDAFLRKDLRLPAGKLCVVENGIDLEQFLAVPPRAPDGTMTFGTIGRLDPVKDHASLLRAFASLSSRHSNIRLRLLGDGALRSELEALAKSLSISNIVQFNGFDPDTAGFLCGVDIYVISSRSEGLPLTLLEAMGAGRPVVATNVGGIPDVIRTAGENWLCQPESPAELAKAMEAALRDTRLAEIGKENRIAVQEHYSVDRMTRDYRRLYETILGNGARCSTRAA